MTTCLYVCLYVCVCVCECVCVSYLSAFVSDHGGQGLGVEATEGEAQAAVHAVSG